MPYLLAIKAMKQRNKYYLLQCESSFLYAGISWPLQQPKGEFCGGINVEKKSFYIIV